jgi:type I restriction enzyme S subunit
VKKGLKKSGWETKTFGEVLKIRNGRNQREVESADGEFPIYGSAGNVMGMATDYICEAGTTIIGRKGNINSPIYADTRFWNVDTAFGLAAKAGMDSRFLYFFCLSYDFSSHNRGTTIPSLVKSELLNIPIPVPPLAEQQRIVGLLDEAFKGLATAKANAEKNLQNARALFESHLQSVFTQRGPGWKQKTLEEIATTFGRGKSKHRPRNEPKLYGGKYPFIQTGDIRNADHFITEYSQTYSEAGLAQSKLWPKGTICITIAANIAETAILGFDACFPDSVIGVVTNPKEAEVGFIEYLLQSFKARIQALGKGSAQANINMGTFENERFPFPPLDRQKAIVEEIDALSAETQRLAAIYSRKLAALEALKKSLLHQAFAGGFEMTLLTLLTFLTRMGALALRSMESIRSQTINPGAPHV